MEQPTIFALATPPGRSGVAVVRVSGGRAAEGLAMLAGGLPGVREASLRTLRNPESGAVIDRTLVLYFAAPASFTGEDVVEYHVHGGRAIIDELIRTLGGFPHNRLAEPGEFTRRAFENGKMDLTAAEAVADLIAAETALQKEQALAQMKGGLADLYHDWSARLARTLAHMEADLDFPDEDLPGGIADTLCPTMRALQNEINIHLDDNRRGEMLRDGVQVAIVGPPNAGKSTLINAIAQRDVAIVSDVPGTTRDIIEIRLDLGGLPIIIADTAGLRAAHDGEQGHDAIESEGVRRALRRAETADIKILVFDAAVGADSQTLSLQDERALIVYNKMDLAPTCPADALGISAHTGAGMERFLDTLTARVRALIGHSNTPSLTRERHRTALVEASAALTRALTAAQPELMAEDIRLAMRSLGRITGAVGVEDLLDMIFRDFCIGK